MCTKNNTVKPVFKGLSNSVRWRPVLLYANIRPCQLNSLLYVMRFSKSYQPASQANKTQRKNLAQHKVEFLSNNIFMVKSYIFTYDNIQTRLLGRPQPQMYPPVALNQYTWVNRTHKHLLYMLQGPMQILKYISLQSYPPTTCKIWK